MERAGREQPAPSAAPAGPVPRGFRHGAALVGSDAELLALAVPFLDAGLREGDLVVLSTSPATAARLGDALGERAAAVQNDPGVSLLGARAPDALARARRYLDRAVDSGSGRMRLFSEVDFGDHPAAWREGQRFESACNRFLVEVPVTSICLYDRRRLPAPVLDSAAATHPLLVQEGTWAQSPAFQDPVGYIEALPLPREPLEDEEPVLAVDDARSLADLRHEIARALHRVVPDPDRRADLHLAASEVAANAFRHGRRPVSARLWSDGARLVCLVTDSGRGRVDPLTGFAPAHGDDLGRGGMGLWLARKLWDSVDLLPGPEGMTVRLSTRVHGTA